jgi:hypothetical protein
MYKKNKFESCLLHLKQIKKLNMKTIYYFLIYSIWGLIYSKFKPLLLNDLKRESKNINQ